jgi:hypothetical protein
VPDVGRRQRHSDLVEYSAAQLEVMLRNDKNMPNARRVKVVAELKFWKARNRQKRSK